MAGVPLMGRGCCFVFFAVAVMAQEVAEMAEAEESQKQVAKKKKSRLASTMCGAIQKRRCRHRATCALSSRPRV
jgi:hypothetical protein